MMLSTCTLSEGKVRSYTHSLALRSLKKYYNNRAHYSDSFVSSDSESYDIPYEPYRGDQQFRQSAQDACPPVQHSWAYKSANTYGRLHPTTSAASSTSKSEEEPCSCARQTIEGMKVAEYGNERRQPDSFLPCRWPARLSKGIHEEESRIRSATWETKDSGLNKTKVNASQAAICPFQDLEIRPAPAKARKRIDLSQVTLIPGRDWPLRATTGAFPPDSITSSAYTRISMLESVFFDGMMACGPEHLEEDPQYPINERTYDSLEASRDDVRPGRKGSPFESAQVVYSYNPLVARMLESTLLEMGTVAKEGKREELPSLSALHSDSMQHYQGEQCPGLLTVVSC